MTDPSPVSVCVPVAPTATQNGVPESPAPSMKCAYRSCHIQGAEKVQCGAPGCDRMVHQMCYQGFLLAKHANLPMLGPGVVACRKKCHEKITKAAAGERNEAGSRKGNWGSDGKGGVADPHTSLKILLDWWMEEGNYSRYSGKRNDGVKKKEFAAKLAAKMSEETLSQRDSKNVINKINHIEKLFRDAYQWANGQTGQGLQEGDPEGFHNYVTKLCPVYYSLLPIMGERSSTEPACLSYTVRKRVQDGEPVDGEPVAEESTKKKKKTKGPFQSSMEFVQSLQGGQNKKLSEANRHNKVIERVEQEKLNIMKKAESRKDDLHKYDSMQRRVEYQFFLLQRYEELAKRYDDAYIARKFPDLKAVMTGYEAEVEEEDCPKEVRLDGCMSDTSQDSTEPLTEPTTVDMSKDLSTDDSSSCSSNISSDGED